MAGKASLWATLSLNAENYFAGVKGVIKDNKVLGNSVKKTADGVKASGKKFDEAFKTKTYNSKARQIQKRNREIKKSFGEVAKGAKDFGEKGVKALAAVAAGAGATGFAILKMGNEYDETVGKTTAQIGLSKKEMTEYGGVIKSIYKNNFGENFEEIGNAIAVVRQNTGDLDKISLANITENAFALKDTFDFEIAESVRAANILMKEFGVSGDEAFNLMVQGAQKGLNQNGDMLDVINEYSTHYKQLGFGANEMFNSLVNGAKEGVWSIDKLGDTVKEFGIKVRDDTASEYLKKLGLSATKIKSALSVGGDAGKAAFDTVTKALYSLNDQAKIYEYGAGIFGTPFEDIGIAAAKAMSNVNGEVSKTKHSMQELKDVRYDNIKYSFESIKRSVISNFVLPIAARATPAIKEFAESFKKKITNGEFDKTIAGVTESFDKLVTSITNHGDDIVNGIAGGIEFIGNSSTFIVDNWDTVKSVLETTFGVFIASQGIVLANNIALIATNPLTPYIAVGIGVIAIVNKIINAFKDLDDKIEDAGMTWREYFGNGLGIFRNSKERTEFNRILRHAASNIVSPGSSTLDMTAVDYGVKTASGQTIPRYSFGGTEFHAKGGILTRPTLLGVSGMTAHIGGEAGAEAILPLSQFWRNLEKYIRSSNSGQQSVNNTIKIYVKSENADDEAIARTIAKKVKAALNNM